MTSGALPDDVRQFILKNIDSVPELELLLLLAELVAELSIAEAASRIYVDEASARLLLEGLVRRRLLAASGDPARYRFAPEDPQDEARVREVAQAYRLHLIPMANLIHSKASGSVQEFARAFDLKKDR
jgi:hypothetical protein